MATTVIDTLITKLKFVSDTKGIKKAEQGMGGLRRSTDFLNARLFSLRGTLFGLAGAFAAIKSIDAFTSQQEAIQGVTQALKNLGATAPATLEEINKFADTQERLTGFGNEKIIKDISEPLLVSGEATKKNFLQIQQIILNLASKSGRDLRSISQQVIEALSRPTGALTLLTQAGIKTKLSFQQQITAMQKTGNIAGATSLVLNLLSKRLKGLAAANADTASGSFIQLKNNIGDLSKSVGSLILQALEPFIKHLNTIILAILKNKKALDKIVSRIAELTKVVLFVTTAFIAFKIAMGFASLIKVFTLAIRGLAIAFGFLSANPIVIIITLLIAAVIGLVFVFVTHFATIKRVVKEVFGFIGTEVDKAIADLKRFEDFFKKSKIGKAFIGEGKQIKSGASEVSKSQVGKAFLGELSKTGSFISNEFKAGKSFFTGSFVAPAIGSSQVQKTITQHNNITVSATATSPDFAERFASHLGTIIKGAAHNIDSGIKR